MDNTPEILWRADIRPGWRVSDQPPYGDGYFYAVRPSDGRTVEATSRDGLVHRMCAADIAKTYREAGEPTLPEELS